MYRTGNRLFLKQTVLIRSLLTSVSAMIKVVVQESKLWIVQQSRGFYHYHVYCNHSYHGLSLPWIPLPWLLWIPLPCIPLPCIPWKQGPIRLEVDTYGIMAHGYSHKIYGYVYTITPSILILGLCLWIVVVVGCISIPNYHACLYLQNLHSRYIFHVFCKLVCTCETKRKAWKLCAAS